MTRKETLLAFISDENYKAMKANEIASILGIPKKDKAELKLLLAELEDEGKIYKNANGKYSSPEKIGLIRGKYSANQKGFGFIIDDEENKFFVPPSNTGGAFNNDTVLAKISKSSDSSSKCSECRIVKIIERGSDLVVGTFQRNKNFGFLIPDDKSFTRDIYISKKHSSGLSKGQKVVCRITKWPINDENPEGCPIEILGFEGDDRVDMLSLIRQYSLSESFPEKVRLSAMAFDSNIDNEDLTGRCDYRDEMIFTIDGDDSKDFDDAVGIRKTDDGYILGVHIADVAHYVSENSALDIEARKRGTSVYLPGMVVPMLPKELSNGICSLNPNEDRLTLSVIMSFDKDGNLTDHEIREGVIRSKHRLTYDNVTRLLEGDEELALKYSDIKDDLITMSELAMILREKRMSKGSIDFNFPEIKIVLDEHGRACDIYKYNASISHKIIEEFMLSANICIAEEMFWCELPFIYRIHENPTPEKINTFKRFVLSMGYRFNINADSPKPGIFAKFYDSIKGSKKEILISKMMLRSLMKAKYSDENTGHFGLGFKYYCHFTSPIRRYPDLVIHRIIKEYINHRLTDKHIRYLKKFVKDASKSSSEAEVRAMEAEREADDMKKAEYMIDKVGMSYDAVITSVTSFGIFAETDFGIEGLISITDLDDDYYEYNEKTMSLQGRYNGKNYEIGDSIRITVKRADPKLREIDYIIESGDEDE